MSNHLLSIFFIPLLLFILISLNIRQKMTGFFLLILGISCYLYLPIRASVDPIVSWGHPDRFYLFYQHISGSQFHNLMLKLSVTEFIKQFLMGTTIYFNGFNCFIWSMGFIGLLAVLFSKKSLLKPLMLCGALNLVFALTYKIHDINIYFLPVLWILIIYSGTGIDIFQKISLPFVKWILVCTLLGIVFVGISNEYYFLNRSNNFVSYHFGKSILQSTPPNTVLFYQGDNPTNSLSYLYSVEKRRQDLRYVSANRNLLPMGSPVSSHTKNPKGSTFRKISDRIKAYPHGVVYLADDHKPMLTAPEKYIYRLPDSNLFPAYYMDVFTREMKAQYLINLAEFECERGDWQSGIQLYNDLDQITCDLPETTQFLALTLASRGRLDDAIRIEKNALLRFPEELSIPNNLAYHYFLSGKNPRQALRLIQDVYRVNPAVKNYVHTYILFNLITGHIDKAKTSLAETGNYIPSLVKELASIEKCQQANLSFPLTQESKNPPAGIIENILNENGAWYSLHGYLAQISHARQLNEAEITLLAKNSRQITAVPGAIYILETQLKRFGQQNKLNQTLIDLHEEIPNFARIKELRSNSGYIIQ